jgi:hypothetical protein
MKMRIASVRAEGRGGTDKLLSKAAILMKKRGIRLCGTVQANTALPGRHHCDMELKVLPDGPRLPISQQRGLLARGCLMDADAIETVAMEVEKRLDGAELLIINKFGKQEATGRGMVPVIVEAVSRGIPVIVGVNALNQDAFAAFFGDSVYALPPDAEAIARWADGVLAVAEAA